MMDKPLTIALSLAIVLGALILGERPARADERQLVDMPPPMQEHMLGNMRDHLRALEGIIGALAEDDIATAVSIAESRLGFSSLDDHGAAHLAQFMPDGMQNAGTELHRAASRFVVAVENSDFEASDEGQRQVYSALRDITAACNACHSSYRIR